MRELVCMGKLAQHAAQHCKPLCSMPAATSTATKSNACRAFAACTLQASAFQQLNLLKRNRNSVVLRVPEPLKDHCGNAEHDHLVFNSMAASDPSTLRSAAHPALPHTNSTSCVVLMPARVMTTHGDSPARFQPTLLHSGQGRVMSGSTEAGTVPAR